MGPNGPTIQLYNKSRVREVNAKFMIEPFILSGFLFFLSSRRRYKEREQIHFQTA